VSKNSIAGRPDCRRTVAVRKSSWRQHHLIHAAVRPRDRSTLHAPADRQKLSPTFDQLDRPAPSRLVHQPFEGTSGGKCYHQPTGLHAPFKCRLAMWVPRPDPSLQYAAVCSSCGQETGSVIRR